jgi:hypothetical protein
MNQMRSKRYSELVVFLTFQDRFEYLKLGGGVGYDTFGFDRWMNQAFYRSSEWRNVRDLVIVRDNGCDLGIPGEEIRQTPLVHHMEPITKLDIIASAEWILDPEYLITVSKRTHNAIHYGSFDTIPKRQVEPRRPGDTKLW